MPLWTVHSVLDLHVTPFSTASPASRPCCDCWAICPVVVHAQPDLQGHCAVCLDLLNHPMCRWVWKWNRHYDPALDVEHMAIQRTGTALQKAKQAEYEIGRIASSKGSAVTRQGPDTEPLRGDRRNDAV